MGLFMGGKKDNQTETRLKAEGGKAVDTHTEALILMKV